MLSAAHGRDLILDTYGGGQPCKEHPARFQNAPQLLHHRLEMLVVCGKMQHRAREHDLCAAIRKAHGLDRFHAEVTSRQLRRQA